MGLQTDQTMESTYVDVRFDDGVLVGTITMESLLDPWATRSIENHFLRELPRATHAVLVDCSRLTGPVSSEFLSTLMRLRNHAEESGLATAVCGLSSALRSAYDVTTLTSIIPAYENQSDAISELRKLVIDEVRSVDSVSDFPSRDENTLSKQPAIAAADLPPPAELVSVSLDHGVLVAKVVTNSLIHERPICDVEDKILEQLTKTTNAVLIDCSQLTHQVSSQFLSMLMRVYYQAKEMGLRAGVCGLSEPLREAYRVTALSSIVPSYEDYEVAIGELREFPELGGNETSCDASAAAGAEECPALRRSGLSLLSWLAKSAGGSAVLVVLGAIVLVGLGFLAGMSLNSLGLPGTGP